MNDRGDATGVAYVDRESRQEVEVRARAVVLTASCLETAHIMLTSRSRRWPDGIANGSGQLGRNLCDHLYGTAAWGFLPQLVGTEPFPDNVSASTIAWMPRWQNLENPHQERFVRGYAVYPGGGCGEFPSIWSSSCGRPEKPVGTRQARSDFSRKKARAPKEARPSWRTPRCGRCASL